MTDERQPTVASICYNWWETEIHSDTGEARITRARLKRCDNAAEALSVEAVHRLYHKLKASGFCQVSQGNEAALAEKLCLIAVTLALVKENNSRRIAELFGEGSEQKTHLSALKFQAIIHEEQPLALLRLLRRALPSIDYRANIRALAQDLYFWNERTRIDWCFAYYGSRIETAQDMMPEHTSSTII